LFGSIGHGRGQSLNDFLQYTVIQIVLLLVQFVIAGALVFDHHWREVKLESYKAL
jgi:hypothetical protein